MRVKGKIIFWNDEKGFGFIAPNEGGKQIFAHIKAFSNRKKQPKIGQVTTYTLSMDKQGRPCADNITRAGERLSQSPKKAKKSISIVGAVIFLFIVSISSMNANVPFLVMPFYIALSLVTFLMYAMDKSAAQNGKWRIQESTLHILSLAGGWPGAIIAQQKLRHKSKKTSFRMVFWVTVLLNCGTFVWLHTPNGAVAVQNLISTVQQVLTISSI